MQILSWRILEGPNIYSLRPVIRMKLDIGCYEDRPSNEIAGFNERLLALLPGLQEHHCSRGRPGGFVERLREGTYLAHIFEHVALEMQCLAGYEVSFGKTRSMGMEGIYDVVTGYDSAIVARKAAQAAEELLQAVLNNLIFNVPERVSAIKTADEQYRLGPSTAAIYEAAVKRGIPVTRFNEENLLVLGYGCQRQRIWATLTGQTSALAADLACDKHLAKKILEDNGILVPCGVVVNDKADAIRALEAIGRPVVIKPLCGNHGNGVTLNVGNEAEVERAFLAASQFSGERGIVVEEYVPGRQYRLCIVDGKMVAAAERIPAYVLGDGGHTVAELVDIANCDPERGEGHQKRLTKIQIDTVAIIVLAKQNLTPQSVPADRQVVYIRENANLSAGGTAVDVTDIVHPHNSKIAEQAARLIGLDVAGVDIVAADITVPISKGSGAVIEINAAPGIRMHHYPSAGKSRDVAARIIDYLFPDEKNGRIPITAITGTNGKTTVTRMISHIWQVAGYHTGMTTTDGIYINGQLILAGDTTGPDSAKMVLTDPAVEVAVLETARGGIIRGGLAFDQCDVGIVTNITEDHIGQDGIENLADLAYIKSLVVETVRPGGVALLNADDPYVAAMSARAQGEIVYFSVEADNIVVRRHLGIGGKAFFVKDDIIYAAHGSLSRPIIHAADIPITLGGIAVHNLQNALIAAAACYCLKAPIARIRQGLNTFAQNPGRLNMMSVADFRVCIDYGHNPASYQALINTVRRMGAKRLVGVIAAPGDRRDDVIINTGRIAGLGFDYIYIKEDGDLRGRQPGQTAALLRQGVLETGFAPAKTVTVLSEAEAVTTVLNEAEPGDLIVIFYEKYDVVMDAINNFHKNVHECNGDTELEEQVVAAGVKIV